MLGSTCVVGSDLWQGRAALSCPWSPHSLCWLLGQQAAGPCCDIDGCGWGRCVLQACRPPSPATQSSLMCGILGRKEMAKQVHMGVRMLVSKPRLLLRAQRSLSACPFMLPAASTDDTKAFIAALAAASEVAALFNTFDCSTRWRQRRCTVGGVPLWPLVKNQQRMEGWPR